MEVELLEIDSFAKYSSVSPREVFENLWEYVSPSSEIARLQLLSLIRQWRAKHGGAGAGGHIPAPPLT